MSRTEFVPSIKEITAMADDGLVSLAATRWLLSTHAAMLEALELLMSCVPGDWKEMAPVSKAIGVYLTGKQLESFEVAIKLAKGGDYERDSSARLIAAAPAMLEALEQADFFLSHSGNQRAIVGDSLQNPSGRWNQFTKTRDQVKAAIRLAKGESHV